MTQQGAPFPALKPGHLRLTEHYLCTEGEGRTLGALTYLIRLSGCDLRCSWCDSKFSSFYDGEERAVPVEKVEAAALKSGAAWVSFTGGEPTYRSDAELKTLAGLAQRLRQRGLKVKVESNGRRLPAALRSCVDLWSLAPKWDSRQAPAKARTQAMDYDESALALFAQRYAPDKLQLKFVVSYDAQAPRAADLERARLILKPLPKMPVFFIPEAYAPGDYLGRARALEQAVMAFGKRSLKGWDLRVQPQMHRICMGINVGVKAVALLSGGMDSVITAALAKAQGRQLSALTLDYGQSHRREITAARWQAKRLGIRHHITLKLPLGAIAVGSLVDGGAINRSGVKKGKPATYVSFRNGVFLAAAASLAEAAGAKEIWGGWCFTDQAGYPDCTPAFFRAFEHAVDAGTWAGRQGGRLKIQAPLGRLSKAASVRLGTALGVDFKHTWTCYKPARGRACGLCDACRLRRQGFKAAHVLDPLR